METIQIHIPKQQLEKLKFAVSFSGLCRAEIIRRALDDYFDKEKESWGQQTALYIDT